MRLGHGLAAVRQAAETVKRRLDHPRGKAKRTAGGIGRACVLVVMRARQPLNAAQINRAHLFATAVFAQEPFFGKDLPAGAREFGLRTDADHPVITRPLAHLPGKETALGLVHSDYRTVWPAF